MGVHFTTEYIDELLKRVDMMEIMDKHGIRVKPGTGINNFYHASFCCNKSDFENGRIRKDTQTYKCRACKEGGNAIHFLMRVVRLSYPEAVTHLAEMYGVELPVYDSEKRRAEVHKEKALKLAVAFYSDQDKNEYMLGRGISEEVLKRHSVGYAPGGRALRSHLEKYGYTKAELLEYKLINSRGLDSFFYRAVVPVYMNGRVIDLYGRSTDDSKSGVKHFYLYGDDILGGIDIVDPGGIVVLYESAINRLAAESHGIKNGVDSGGAHKFSVRQVRKLQKKGVRKVLVLYDGDNAGRAGALSSGELLVDAGIDVWVGELPEKQDPAKMLKEEGKSAFLAAIHNPKTFAQYKMFQELSKYSLEEIEMYVSAMKSQLQNIM
jgi:DNA primase catalytic core